jgi:hypothetical protein
MHSQKQSSKNLDKQTQKGENSEIPEIAKKNWTFMLYKKIIDDAKNSVY